MTQPPPPPPAQPPPKRKPIRFGCVTLIGFLGLGVVGAVVLIILIAGGYIFTESQKAAHQATPTGAVNSYLDSVLHDRKTDTAENYTCNNDSIKRLTKSTIDGINNYTHKYPGAVIDYTWSEPALKSKKGDRATVTSNVSASTTASERVTNSANVIWTFDVRNESGWKVCGLTK
jgi:hypothetical protein